MEEYKIGEVFQFGKIKLKCVEVSHFDCVGCILAQTSPCNEFVGGCAPYETQDKKNVIFVEVEKTDKQEGKIEIKQTVEEAAHLFAESRSSDSAFPAYYQEFIAGAEWQIKQSLSVNS